MMVIVLVFFVCILVYVIIDFLERFVFGGEWGFFLFIGDGLFVGVGGGLSNSLLILFNVILFWVVDGFSIVKGNVIGIKDFVLNLFRFEDDFWFV